MSEEQPSDFYTQMKQAAERHAMRLEEFKHSLQRLWDELDEDQLQTLSTMMHILAYSDNSRKTAAQWEGVVCTYLKLKYGVCITCNVNHDTEILSPPEERQEPEMKETSEGQLYFDQGDFKPLDLTNKQREQMYLYHIDDAYEDGTGRFIGFVCTGINGSAGPCGLIYPSIEDRMLKEPENCHGCFERIAHG